MWVPIVIIAVVLLFVHNEWKLRKDFNVSGPFCWPLVGRLPAILYGVVTNKHYEKSLENFMKYGKSFRYKIFSQNVVYISEPEDLKHFFTTNFNNYVKGKRVNECLYDLFGDGIFNASGEQWRVQRQTVSTLFHFNNLQTFFHVFHKSAQTMADIVEKQTKGGKPIDMQQIFMRYTLDSIGTIGYGVDINSIHGNEKAEAFANCFEWVQANVMHRFLTYPAFKYFPSKEFNRRIQIVDNFIADIISARKKDIANGADTSNSTDLLTSFINAKDNQGNPMFEDKYLLDAVKNFIIAGRDSTAAALTWSLYLISTHRDVEAKILKEIRDMTAAEGVNYESVAKMSYLRHVIDEALRLYPPIPEDGRTAVHDDIYPSGLRVKAGTDVIFSAFAQHRFPDYFVDPERFNPDRWETDQIKPFTYVPFFGGPRVCLGQNLAYQELKVALCNLLPRLKFTLVEGHPIQYFISLSMPTKYGLRMRAERRV